MQGCSAACEDSCALWPPDLLRVGASGSRQACVGDGQVNVDCKTSGLRWLCCDTAWGPPSFLLMQLRHRHGPGGLSAHQTKCFRKASAWGRSWGTQLGMGSVVSLEVWGIAGCWKVCSPQVGVSTRNWIKVALWPCRGVCGEKSSISSVLHRKGALLGPSPLLWPNEVLLEQPEEPGNAAALRPTELKAVRCRPVVLVRVGLPVLPESSEGPHPLPQVGSPWGSSLFGVR